MEFVLHLVSKEIFYEGTMGRSMRVIDPEEFGLIEDWIYRIFMLMEQQHQHFQKITQMLSTLISVLINYELKIENYMIFVAARP